MDNLKEKLPTLKTIVYLLMAIVVTETGLLAWMIPDKTNFHWMALLVIIIALGYICVLCLRLIRELNNRI